MGRYYYGDIEGKMVFGIQSSDDADHFGCIGKDVFKFYGCNCTVDNEVVEKYNEKRIKELYTRIKDLSKQSNSSYNKECKEIEKEIDRDLDNRDPNLFCNDCYDSFLKHKNNTLKERSLYQDKTADPYLYYKENYISYDFTFEHIDTIKKVLKELEPYNLHILSFEIEDNRAEDFSITFEEEINDSLDHELDKTILENVARICLGRQILYCLENYKTCSFTVEL